MVSSASIKLRCDSSPFESALAELKALDLSGEIVGRLIGLIDSGRQVARLEQAPAHRAGELLYLIEPSDELLKLLAAARAGDVKTG